MLLSEVEHITIHSSLMASMKDDEYGLYDLNVTVSHVIST